MIDTNVVIAALRSRRGASARLLTVLGTGLFEAHISIPLALEYEDVLTRQGTILGFTLDDIDSLVDSLCAVSRRHERVYFSWRPFLSDKKDDFILDLAVKAGCDTIVTYNKADFRNVEQFGIRVLDPRQFLQEIGVIE